MLFYISMKNYKNIACIDFVNVNIALNSHAYEGNLSFILEFIKRCIFFCSLTHEICVPKNVFQSVKQIIF